MDLGLDGQGRARHRRLEGDRPRDRRGPRRRGRAGRADVALGASARRTVAAQIGARGYAFDSDDLDAIPALLDAVEARPRPDRHLHRQHRRPARRRPARLHPRAVGGGAPHAARSRRWTILERVLPGHARARLRARRRDRLDAPCASRSTSCSSPTPTAPASSPPSRSSRASSPRDGVTFNTVHPGRIATDRIDRHRRLTRGRRGAGARDRPGRPPRHRRRSSPRPRSSCARPRPSYITGTPLLVDGGLTRSV